MKKAVIATLLSLLVFPGTGHVWLKQVKTGMVIMAISLLSLLVFIVEIFKIVWQTLEEINYGRANDMAGLTELVHQQISQSNSGLLHLSLVLLLVCWFGSVADVLRISLSKKPG